MLAVAKYIQHARFQDPPYTNSNEFLSFISDVIPADRKYLLKDFFETITLYDNKTVEVSSQPVANKMYKMKLSVSAKKYRADERGMEKETPADDIVDIGIFGPKDKEGATKFFFSKNEKSLRPR